jgi:hypothetical protein
LTKVDETRQAVPALDTAAVAAAGALLCKQVEAWAAAFSAALRPLGEAMTRALSVPALEQLRGLEQLSYQSYGPRADHGDPCGEQHPPVGQPWPR